VAGFFGLFGGNKNQGSEYFLEPDDAKTMGDIEYMRTPKAVRKSFPKAKLGEDNEVVNSHSATESSTFAEGVGYIPTSAPKPQPTSESSFSSSASSERRRTDTGMDMFRSMAKNIRK
jgi:hypothetical protein